MILALLLFLMIPHTAPVSATDNPAVPAILARAESLFQSMKARDYPAIFAALTEKSRETIVAETSSAIAAAAKQAPPPQGISPDAGVPPVPAPGGSPAPDRDAVRADFLAGGPIARDYWDAFLRRFDPDDPLERSRWEMGAVEKERAEVRITRIGSDRPAVLKLSLENGTWKVGLAETFRGR